MCLYNTNELSNTDKNYKKMAKSKKQALQDRLNIYAKAINTAFVIGKNANGYYISYNDSPIALTSGRTIKELAAYIDGLRDMILIAQNKK